MKIFIGNDHTAVEMKTAIVEYLESQGHEVINLGTNDLNPVDYPDLGFAVGEAVGKDVTSLGIVICGSGIGISIAANKVPGIRAALCYEKEAVELARQHNNANILALGARFIAVYKAVELVKVFLQTQFEEDRHSERVRKLCDYNG
ncbi:ribose-5-phosphate isomerase B [Spiroplasma sabaudiense Ar-1343]|uniref:Ribose-5-phosphate isomerase B n=1 Tax=Spiroplasma sabaudiense Ar-1343 TaxID=1276257 RepID=W6A914_9MOLU|nr:ribose 5-phosphate isomerase B [Spiroplasma sabaudiense]AHI53456.1 ribose-5-phosphate isomerase B [Spiroplasma sabaudiense Ar-1343]